MNVDDLIRADVVKDCLESGSVISLAITLGALVLDRDELGSRHIAVLGLALGDNLAAVVGQSGRLGDRCASALSRGAVVPLYERPWTHEATSELPFRMV